MLTDRDAAWFQSMFHAQCVIKTDSAWQAFFTEIMQLRHPGEFLQVDPAGRGDKGCDGYVHRKMFACYGAQSPNERRVTAKVKDDYGKACKHWGDMMDVWAFVHNNGRGLPDMAVNAIMELRATLSDTDKRVEVWPPQTLWNNALRQLERDQLLYLLGAPPSDHPVGMSYIARCVESLARTRLQDDLEPVASVPFGKIEHNEFGDEVAGILVRFQRQTTHVRYYFSKASPGESAQVSQTLRTRYDALRAELQESDAVFHSLVEELRHEAFGSGGLADEGEQRGAATAVVTHFFEECEIFEAPPEVVDVSSL